VNLALGKPTVIYDGRSISFKGQKVRVEEMQWDAIAEHIQENHVALPVEAGKLAVIPFRELVGKGEEAFVPSYDHFEPNHIPSVSARSSRRTSGIK